MTPRRFPVLLLAALVALPATGCVVAIDEPDEVALAEEHDSEPLAPEGFLADEPEERGRAGMPGWGRAQPAARPGTDSEEREDPEPDPWTPKTKGPQDD